MKIAKELYECDRCGKRIVQKDTGRSDPHPGQVRCSCGWITSQKTKVKLDEKYGR